MSEYSTTILLLGDIILFVAFLTNFNEGLTILACLIVLMGAASFIGPNINP